MPVAVIAFAGSLNSPLPVALVQVTVAPALKTWLPVLVPCRKTVPVYVAPLGVSIALYSEADAADAMTAVSAAMATNARPIILRLRMSIPFNLPDVRTAGPDDKPMNPEVLNRKGGAVQ